MPSHPPVPPNCPYFAKDGEDWLFRAPNHWSGVVLASGVEEGLVWTDEHLNGWRPIIAAVARCAWLDEAAKLNGYIAESGEDTSGYIDHLFKRADMLKNAQAWREWGRG